MIRLSSQPRRSKATSRRSPFRSWFRVLPLEDRLAPAAFAVSTLADSGAGSLRDQVAAANALAGADTITFDKSISGGTITLTTGEIAITSDILVDGNGVSSTTISGNNSSRIFNINGAGTLAVTIQDLQLTKGATTGVNDGAAIFVQDENVTIDACTLINNKSSSDGGAVRLNAAGAKLTVIDCDFNSNTAAGTGGAVSAVGSATVTLSRSDFVNNSALGAAGVNMSAGGDLTVLDCAFRDNNATSGSGGGAFLSGTFTNAKFTNSTIHSNSASVNGGGVALGVGFAGSPTFNNCTLTENSAGTGDGGGIARLGGTSTVTLTSSIVFDNTAGGTGPDLFSAGTVKANVSLVETKSGVTTFSGDTFTNGNLGNPPLLGVLASNGGPTVTRLPGAGSPAIDAGSNPEGLVNDQRGTGFFRVRGKAADIGAVEIPDDLVVTNTNDSGAGSLRQTLLDATIAFGDDTIVFDSTVFATAKTITLTTGELSIASNTVVTGPSAKVTVSGNNAGRVLNVFNAGSAINVSISNMTFTAGKVTGAADGGAILVNSEDLFLTNCSVTNSSSQDEGGGIRVTTSGAFLQLDQCTVAGNSANLSGGGIAASAGTTVVILNSTLSGNTAGGGGGGVIMLGAGTFTLRGSTVSGNSGNTGGGVQLAVGAGTTSIGNSTIVNNTATGGFGGGIICAPGTLNIDSTIVSGNVGASAPDISQTSGTTNVNASAVGSGTGFTPTGTGNLAFGTDLKLGTLGSNGGPTQTHAPALDSPVLSKGSNLFASTVDQRGTSFPRQRGAGVDIGAVEVAQLLVSNTNQSGGGSFAQAVADSNAFGGSDTITFDPTIFATNKVINLAGTLALNTSMAIQGPAANVTLSGQGANRIFTMANGITYTFSNLDLLLAKATTDGGAMSVNQSNAKLTFTNCTFGFNTTTAEGGVLALSSASTNSVVTFTDCNISSNATTGAGQDGGAIRSDAAITLNLIRTTLSNNDATGDGGAISLASGSSLLVLDTTLSSNDAGLTGGAIALNGAPGGSGLKIINSTLSGNKSAQDGGGLSWTTSSGTLTLQNSTITNNTASAGGGGGLSVTTGSGNLSIESTIVSGNVNAGAPDIDNPNTTTVKTSAVGDNLGFILTNAGGNLPFQPHANLKLSSLTNNGGPTSTHSPQAGSPLLNAGSNPAALTSDQRGTVFSRTANGGTDIGSVEVHGFIVKNTNDAGLDSLRNILAISGAQPGAETITFDPVVFATAKSISLTSGQLDITSAMTITGPAAGVTLDGNQLDRVVEIEGAGVFAVTISDVSFINGKLGSGAGAGLRIGDAIVTLLRCKVLGNAIIGVGGGISSGSGSQLTLTDCDISGNQATSRAGGLSFSGASLLVQDSVIANNSAGDGAGIALGGSGVTTIENSAITGNLGSVRGGGIYNAENSKLTVRNSTIAANKASLGGGGIFSYGLLLVEGSTVSGNSADSAVGGGIRAEGTFYLGELVLRNSTISGNSSKFEGGGFAWYQFANGEALIQNCTITDNATTTGSIGGGVYLSPFPGVAKVTIESSIIFGNIAKGTPDVAGPFTITAKSSFLGTNPGPGPLNIDAFTTSKIGVDPLLGPLQDNGGATLTRLPALNSPVINNGTNPAALTTDQRGAGFARDFGFGIDVGAVEAQVFVVTNTNNSGAGSLRDTVAAANGLLGFDTIIFDPVVFGTAKTITLTTGQITITDTVSIFGPSVGVTISGNNASRILSISSGGTDSELVNLTFSQGKATISGGAAVLSTASSLTMINCVVTDNHVTAGTLGGAISASFAGSALTFIGCTIANNTSSTDGGGIAMPNVSHSLTLQDTTVSGNTSGNRGGGIFVQGNLVIRNSTISGNTAQFAGGGVFVQFGASAVVQNSTIAGNKAITGGGGGFGSGNSSTQVDSAIIFGNTANTNPDISGAKFTVNTSLIGNTTGAAAFIGDAFTNANLGQDPLLGPLQNNGGPTLTMLPANTSKAVNHGSNPAALAFDQRGAGFPRSIGVTDIGAVETRALVVTTSNNTGEGSLRDIIADANALVGPDTITFDPTVFAKATTITLLTALPTIADNVVITGPGAGLLTVRRDAGAATKFRVFTFADAADNLVCTLSGVTVSGGDVSGRGGGVYIGATDALTLDAVVISGNKATADGGGVAAATSTILTLLDCTVSGNSTGADGGGIYQNLGTLVLDNCTISGNTAAGDGGGVSLFSFGLLNRVRNSTLSGNSAGVRGGGIASHHPAVTPLEVHNSTITNNSAGTAGGGLAGVTATAAFTIRSSIIAGNTATSAPDIAAAGKVSAGTSLIGASAGFTLTSLGGNLPFGTDPLLGPLANNGGPTQTHALLAGSVAINAGSNLAGLTTDQRGSGFVRVFGAAADMGAFEFVPPATAAVQVNNGVAQRSRVTTLKITFDQIVTLPGSPETAFMLARQGDNAVVNLAAAVDNSGPGTVVTLTFTGGAVNANSLADGRYTLTVFANQVSTVHGELDGNGDGIGGDDFVLVGDSSVAPKLFRLFGDADGDGDVDATDFGAFRTAFGTANNTFDFDNDGDVDASDFGVFRQRFGTSV